MKAFGLFLAGFLVAWIIAPELKMGTSHDRTEKHSLGNQVKPQPSVQGSPKLPRVSQHRGSGKSSDQDLSDSDTMSDTVRLKAQLLGYRINEPLESFLAELSDHNARAIMLHLDEFRERLRDHEAENAQTLFESAGGTTIIIPAMFADGTAKDQFIDELGVQIGEGEARQFIDVADDLLGPELAYWGAAEQTVEIDLTLESPRVTQRFENEDQILGSQNTDYSESVKEFDHLFEVHPFNEQNKALLDKP
jgi:hypothetical protein